MIDSHLYLTVFCLVAYISFWVWLVWSAPVIDTPDEEYLKDDILDPNFCVCEYHYGCTFKSDAECWHKPKKA
jgi:hypothetical protein